MQGGWTQACHSRAEQKEGWVRHGGERGKRKPWLERTSPEVGGLQGSRLGCAAQELGNLDQSLLQPGPWFPHLGNTELTDFFLRVLLPLIVYDSRTIIYMHINTCIFITESRF